MENMRVDSVGKYYDDANRANRFSNVFLAGSILSSLVVIFLGSHVVAKNVMNIAFVVLTFLYFFTSNVTSLYLLRKAEVKRTTHLISNSFAVSLDDEYTTLYYNNNQVPSISRLGLNTFENVLHSSTTASMMLRREWVKVTGYIVIWLVITLYRHTSLDLIATVSQTLLTTTLILNFIKLLVLKFGFERICDACRTLYLNGIKDNDIFNAQVIDLFVRYESLKAGMGVMLSSKLFLRANQSTSQNWNEIKQRLGLS